MWESEKKHELFGGLFDKRAILGELFHERIKSLSDHFFVLVDEETHRRFSFLYLEGS